MARNFISERRSIVSGGIRRRELLGRSVAIASAAPLAAATSRLDVLAQDAEATVAGGGVPGENAFEFVAIIHQRAFEFELSGYLTRVAGIEPSLLFTNPDPTNRDAASARLTLHGAATGTSRSIVENVFDVNAQGSLAIYFNEGAGADLGTPESVQAGVRVGTVQTRIQSVITVIAPQTGLANGFGDFVITAAEPFKIAESTFQFQIGEPLLRLSHVGSGTLLDPDLPESILYIAGNASNVN